MRRTPRSKRIRIVPEPFAQRIQPLSLHAGAQRGVIVDALPTRHDFLAAHEEVVGVCEGGEGGVGGGIEGAELEGVFVDGVEVCMVF